MSKIKNNNLISLIILIVVALAVIYFLGIPFARQSVENYKSIKDKKAELAAIEKNINNLETLKSKTSDISETIQKAETFIPNEADMGSFLVQLEAAAQKSNINISNIDAEDKSQTSSNTQSSSEGGETGQTKAPASTSQTSKLINASANQTSLQVEVTGSYSGTISFLERMRKLSRFNIIKNLSITSGTDTTKNQLTASFLVTIFNNS